MKLLFDQNISFKIVKKVDSYFSRSEQVRSLGLENKSDKEIWEYAKTNEYIIVSFDSDFYDFSIIWGTPPKIIWLRTTDQRTGAIVSLLKNHSQTIADFIKDENLACLEIINTN